ncbi:DUF4328 domain-containing protein [Streptomyces sp. P38-E01]|uniref:DUF4328 domain-containing protein n=1 Tax=Streptomyces tardus TaxID=2780544 RepID=A0A949JE49_9ACTN|nr:protein kinase [Streptomyces tardus]MBU7598382.1 DUF4328 domain-containing protein [Streptomyces tardus]
MQALRSVDPQRIGPYRLLARLGEGGMGTVYLAQGARGQRVALKAIRADASREDGFRARFVREIEHAGRVESRWTARVLDSEPGADGCEPWVATEFVPGPSLQELVAGQGPLPVRSAAALGAGLARALDAVHGAGLVHRDLKPSNVMMGVDGPRLVDFGVARLVDASTTGGLTRTGASVGSPGYMSPEQVLGRHVTAATDVFCLGGVLVFATTGRLPFPVDDTANQYALMFAVVQDDPELSDVPQELRALVTACLAKDAAERPEVAALVTELTEHAGNGGGTSANSEPWLPARALVEVARIAQYAVTRGVWRADESASEGGPGGGPEGGPGGVPEDSPASGGPAGASDEGPVGVRVGDSVDVPQGHRGGARRPGPDDGPAGPDGPDDPAGPDGPAPTDSRAADETVAPQPPPPTRVVTGAPARPSQSPPPSRQPVSHRQRRQDAPPPPASRPQPAAQSQPAAQQPPPAASVPADHVVRAGAHYVAPPTGVHRAVPSGWGGTRPSVRSPHAWATALYWVIGLYAALKCGIVLAFAGHSSEISQWKEKNWADWEQIDTVLGSVGLLMGLDSLMLLVFFALLVTWFWHVRSNAEAFRPGECRYSTGMAVGGWFIPLAFWVLPYQIARDVWHASLRWGPDHEATLRSWSAGHEWQGQVLLRWWWVMYVVSGVAGLALYGVVAAMEGAPDREANLIDFDLMISMADWAIVLNLLWLPLLILSIVVVRRLTELQGHRAWELREGR